jgi:hypothetical protein
MTTAIDIAAAVARGELDDDLDMIASLINDRRKMNRQIDGLDKFAALKVGDRVTISSTVRPKYLAGLPATVTKKNRTRVVIDLDAPAGRFHRNITAPAEMLDLDTEAAAA